MFVSLFVCWVKEVQKKKKKKKGWGEGRGVFFFFSQEGGPGGGGINILEINFVPSLDGVRVLSLDVVKLV